MAIDGMFVVDAVAHGFDNRPQNEKAGNYAHRIIEANFGFQNALIPEPYVLEAKRYFTAMTADGLISAFFRESDTDIVCYHTVPTWGVFHDFCPMSVGLEMKRRYPHRTILYGGVSPLEGSKAIEDLHQQVEEWGIKGLKLYPVDVIDGNMRSFALSDQELLYPLVEECERLGITTIAVHKALPLGTAPMDPFRPGDVDYAARDFPKVNFELVHGAFAFLDETAMQIARFDNVYVNLEVTAQLAIRHPQKFARILGELLLFGGAKKILWATGCSFTHPQPALEAFAAFQMPEAMMADGYPQVDRETKESILGENFARMHNLDLDEIKSEVESDELSQERQVSGLERPWALV